MAGGAAVMSGFHARPASQLLSSISPTYVSSDLLTPEQRGRITTPAAGYQVVQTLPLGGHTWGENVSSYGGIGKLPFLGKTRPRDLYVSRSHRHFDSGLSKCLSEVQPYERTSLTLSECRLNDQILPATFYVSFDPRKYVNKDDIPVQPYFSHTCKCEVLPRHDEARRDSYGRPVLSERSVLALRELYAQLYDTPRYFQVYPDNTAVILERLHRLLEVEQERSAGNQQESSGPEGETRVLNRAHGFLTSLFDSPDCENPYIIRGVLLLLLDRQDLPGIRVLLEKIQEKLAREGSLPSKNDLLMIKEFSIVDTLLEILDDDQDTTAKTEQIRGLFYEGGIPVGLGDDFKRSRGILKRYGPAPISVISSCRRDLGSAGGGATAKKNVRFNAERVNANGPCRKNINQGPLPGLPQYKKYLEKILAVPHSIDEEKNKSPSSGSVLVECYKNSQQRTPLLNGAAPSGGCGSGGGSKLPPIPPLAACLHPTGDRIQDRLGIKFKTEAHRRFHALYPDPIPDLRDSHITPKKYFFFGYHASAFRG